MSEPQLIGAAPTGIAPLPFLIVRVRLHAFVALLIASLAIGVGAGMPLDDVLAECLAVASLPPLLLGFVAAAVIRLMQGSATVAMLTAGGLVAALLGDIEMTKSMLALLVIAIAAGATCASRVNDSGFWLVNRYLGLSVPDTVRSWTATTTIISVVSIVLVLVLVVSGFVG